MALCIVAIAPLVTLPIRNCSATPLQEEWQASYNHRRRRPPPVHILRVVTERGADPGVDSSVERKLLPGLHNL